MARQRPPNVRRRIAPAEGSEAYRSETRPRQRTTTRPMNPAIENRRCRMAVPSRDRVAPGVAPRCYTGLPTEVIHSRSYQETAIQAAGGAMGNLRVVSLEPLGVSPRPISARLRSQLIYFTTVAEGPALGPD